MSVSHQRGWNEYGGNHSASSVVNGKYIYSGNGPILNQRDFAFALWPRRGPISRLLYYVGDINLSGMRNSKFGGAPVIVQEHGFFEVTNHGTGRYERYWDEFESLGLRHLLVAA